MSHRRTLVLIETTASLAWLGMDACWMFGATQPALGLAALTLALSFGALCLVPPTWPSRLVSAAMTSWVGMNVLWMAHDLRLVREGLLPSKVLFVLGAAMLAAALLIGRHTAVSVLASRARWLRVHPQRYILRRSVRHARRGNVRRRTPPPHRSV